MWHLPIHIYGTTKQLTESGNYSNAGLSVKLFQQEKSFSKQYCCKIDGNGKHADHFRFVVDACSELNLRQANYLSSIFYLKFRFYTH